MNEPTPTPPVVPPETPRAVGPLRPSRLSQWERVIFGGVLATIIVGGVLLLASMISDSGVSNADFARGLITTIFVGGTMVIAIILVLYNINSESEDRDKRFDQSNQVLVSLIGIVGTILGFYFGQVSAIENPSPGNDDASAQTGEQEPGNGEAPPETAEAPSSLPQPELPPPAEDPAP